MRSLAGFVGALLAVSAILLAVPFCWSDFLWDTVVRPLWRAGNRLTTWSLRP
jgi:hypothetical protein